MASAENKKLESRLRAAFLLEGTRQVAQMTNRLGRAILAGAAAAALTGCAVPGAEWGNEEAIDGSPWGEQSSPTVARPGAWVHHTLPGKSPTRFEYVRKDGRDALAVLARSSASMLRSPVRIEPEELGRVRFSWKVPALIEQADMAVRDKEDAAVRVILAFEGDRSRLSSRDAALSEAARLLTGEPMPYATLMYVWCNRRPAGTVIVNPRTDRIRKLVVESGGGRLGRWLDYERDIRADYERVFGEKPGALVGIAIMTDTDNTRSSAEAWYGPVRLSRKENSF
jgi:hypothetical protein